MDVENKYQFQKGFLYLTGNKVDVKTFLSLFHIFRFPVGRLLRSFVARDDKISGKDSTKP